MKIDNNGDAHVTLDEFNNATFSSGDKNNQSLATNKLFSLKFYLIGDIKGVFQILGRNGYDSSYCMFCKCRPRKWKDEHSVSSGIHAETCVNAEKWTIFDLTSIALDQNQKESSGASFVSVGVRTFH